MKTILVVLLILGSILISVGYQKQYSKCPNPTIEYRFIPRTFYDEQLSEPNIMKQFSDMFEKQTIWIKNRNIDEPKPSSLNNYYNKLSI
jgi:hypothetical protein